MRLGLIWAQSRTGVIGRDGVLPWHVPEDLAHFRQVTDGHPVIMGRRTWESLPPKFRPLPGRRNLVISHRQDLRLPAAEVVASLEEALTRVAGAPAWIIGGGQVYAAALPHADVVEVTEVDLDVAGDTYAPPLTGWRCSATGDWQTSRTGVRYRFRRFTRPG